MARGYPKRDLRQRGSRLWGTRAFGRLPHGGGGQAARELPQRLPDRNALPDRVHRRDYARSERSALVVVLDSLRRGQYLCNGKVLWRVSVGPDI